MKQIILFLSLLLYVGIYAKEVPCDSIPSNKGIQVNGVFYIAPGTVVTNINEVHVTPPKTQSLPTEENKKLAVSSKIPKKRSSSVIQPKEKKTYIKEPLHVAYKITCSGNPVEKLYAGTGGKSQISVRDNRYDVFARIVTITAQQKEGWYTRTLISRYKEHKKRLKYYSFFSRPPPVLG